MESAAHGVFGCRSRARQRVPRTRHSYEVSRRASSLAKWQVGKLSAAKLKKDHSIHHTDAWARGTLISVPTLLVIRGNEGGVCTQLLFLLPPARPSGCVPCEDMQLNVDLYTYRSQRIWKAHQCSVYQQTPHQSLHLSFLILLQSYTLELRHLMACFGRVFHEKVMTKKRKIVFACTKVSGSLGWHRICLPVVAHHEDDPDDNRIAELGKGNSVHINGMSNLPTPLGVHVVRPLLAVRKSDLVDFAERSRVCYMQDSTLKWSRRGRIRRTLDKIATEDLKSHVSFLSQLSRAWSQWNWRGTGTPTVVSGASMRDWSQRITARNAVPGLLGTWPLTMTSIREYKLCKNEFSKLHHLKRELEDEIRCQSRQEGQIRGTSWRTNTRGYCCYKFTEYQQQFEQQFQYRFQQQSNRDCHIDAGWRKQSGQLKKTESYPWYGRGGWSWSLSGIVFNDILTVIVWCKSTRSPMSTLTELFLMITGREKLRRKSWYSKVCIRQSMRQKCFQVLGMHVLSTDLVSLVEKRLICEQGGTWTTLLNIQKCGHIAQGLFFGHQQSGNLPQNAEICAMKSTWVSSVDCWRTFITNCEENTIRESQ